jgi:hypothetical protein
VLGYIGVGSVHLGVCLTSNSPFEIGQKTRVFNSQREVEAHGVSLLHLLDHVDWESSIVWRAFIV